MPLTNAQKQARARAKRTEKMARYEAALREIAVRLEGEWLIEREWLSAIVLAALDNPAN